MKLAYYIEGQRDLIIIDLMEHYFLRRNMAKSASTHTQSKGKQIVHEMRTGTTHVRLLIVGMLEMDSTEAMLEDS
jgi:hypothetical protein